MSENNYPSQKVMHIREYTGQARASKDLFVYEKIDGSNCSIRKEDGIVTPYTRSRKVIQKDLRSFYFRDFFNWTYSIPELHALEEDKIIFGEWTHYGFGHINYNPEYMNKFFLLAVFDRKENKYLHPEKTNELITSLNLNDKLIILPVLQKRNIDQTIAEEIVKSPSNFYEGPKEGIVIHKYGESFKSGLRMEKYFSHEFREIDMTKKEIEKYVTKRRLIKAAQNLHINRKSLSFENVAGAAVDDILRDHQEYKRKELIEAFLNPKIMTLFKEKIIPCFHK